MARATTTRGHTALLLAGLVAMSSLLAGCAETRQPSQEVIEDLGVSGWVLVFEGPLDDALVGDNADLVGGNADRFRTQFSVLPSVQGWVHIWHKDTARVAVSLFYTGNEIANPLAGARRLRRTMEEWRMVWTREYEDVASASVTLEMATDDGVKEWVYGANRAYVFVIGFDGAPRELIGEIFEAQIAVLPEFNAFDSIRPGVAATYILGMVLAFGYGLNLHRRRSLRLAESRVEVFP